MSIARIRKNDMVIAITGEHAGQTGRVLSVDPTRGVAVVEGLNIVKRAVRATQDKPQGGHTSFEAPIQLSNLMPYDAELKKGVRISRVREGDRMVRKVRGSGRALD